MGRLMAQTSRCALITLMITMLQISHSRKTAETGGGAGGGGGGTCQEVYLTIYQAGITDKIALDYGQAEDEGVTLVSELFTGYGCTNITQLGSEDHEPYIENTCDPDDEYDTCAQLETSWNCTVQPSAWDNFSANAFTLNSPVVDDCSAEPNCLGAPLGAQACTYTPLPSALVYPTKLLVTVNGDRCVACGMVEDYCPKYYDAHSCTVEWEYLTEKPTEATFFSIEYTVNAAASATWTMQAVVLALLLCSFRNL